mmetsp:Transcript_9047/g.11396  ORF Transcript_9047/g.11396 Transcript_9047/m.11396 type:complete len:246 (-) Transcript_9047:501-1238(-)
MASPHNVFTVRSKPRNVTFTQIYAAKILNCFLLLSIQTFFDNFIQHTQLHLVLNIPSLESYLSWVLQPLFAIYFSYSVIKPFMNKKRTAIQNICQVQIFPWGIQIEECTSILSTMTNNDREIQNIEGGIEEKCFTVKKNINENVQFIPMEEVVDCVLNEIVLGYKVQNSIVFRIKSNKRENIVQETKCFKDEIGANDKKGYGTQNMIANKNIALVTAFSTKMVEMTYTECIELWKGISETLTRYQ